MIQNCQPQNNGELYQCLLQISQKLALCADQTDALIKWQHDNDTPHNTPAQKKPL